MKRNNLTWYLISFSAFMAWMGSLVLWISIPEERTLNICCTILALVLLISAIFMRFNEVKTFAASSRFKAVSANFFSAVLVAAILGLVNHLAYKNPFQWDVTPSKSNTLTQQSKSVLKNLDASIEAIVFAPKSNQAAVQKILELYQLEKRDLSITTYDPELRPDLVQLYEIKEPMAVVWQQGDRRQKVIELNELGLTNGLIRLGRTSLPKIYYDTGHDQARLDGSDQQGRSLLRDYLVNANYAIQESDTKRWSQVPDDADILMIWGPKRDFMDSEIKVIDQFLTRGGKLLVALDPDLNADPVKNLRQLLASKGLVASNSLVIDTLNNVNGSNGSVPIANRFSKDHVITKNFPGQVFFPLTGFVTLGEQAEGEGLVYSTDFPAAWGEMSPQEFVQGKVAYNEGQDVKGPVAYAAVAKIKSGGTIALYANSTFVDNAYAKYASNHILVLNTLSWMTGDDQLISFDLAGVNNEPVFISSPQLGVIFFFSVVFAPLTLFALAVFNYRRRRVQ
tara:strand:+ start:10256 stop:11779 length:1524 start_codon:yes stop_codon:yes gene_type:complete